MDRKFLIGWLILFVCWFLGSFVVHGVLLNADYTALQGTLYRTAKDSEAHFPLMILAHVMMSGALVWIYARGREAAKPWLGQGVRFGIAVAFLAVVPIYMIYYVVQPTPEALVVKQIVFETVLTILLGIVVAWWYRK